MRKGRRETQGCHVHNKKDLSSFLVTQDGDKGLEVNLRGR